MPARLGEVLYWAACAIGAPLLVAGAITAWIDATDRVIVLVVLCGSGLLSLLFGRACLYVLAGR